MDRSATIPTRPRDPRLPSGAPTLLEDDLSVEPSVEPPVQYPLDDEERNLIDLVEDELVVED